MKRILESLTATLFSLLLVFVSNAFAAEPYAPLHKFQDKEFRGAFGTTLEEAKEMELWPPAKEQDVPEKSAIEAPPYPGAEIVYILGPHKAREGGKFVYLGLSAIDLVSLDPYEKVLSFYKEKLQGWNEKAYENSYYFAKSGAIQINSSVMEVPHLGILKIDGLMNRQKYTDLVPEAQTVITVYFQREK